MVKKEYSYTSTFPMGRTACTEPQYLYRGALLFGQNAEFLFGLNAGDAYTLPECYTRI